MRRLEILVLSVGMAAAVLWGVPSVARAEPEGLKHCAVSTGRTMETAKPEEVGLDSAALAEAIRIANDPLRRTFHVFRNNCLIATGARNAENGGVAWNLWSSTKSVVALVAGIAADERRLNIDDPIGAYLPPGLGDEAHRAIKVRHLLDESSGMRVAVASEGITGLAQFDPNVVVQALGLPMDHEPGTTWQYSQRAVDLLVYVVQQAVGEDFQSYAQRKLFTPLGIPASDYYWARDRSGNTYGYAHLVLPPADFVKLGLLIGNQGAYGGTQVVSAEYLRRASEPSPAKPCFGFLLVVNGPGCSGSFPGLPSDAVQMSGMMRQDNFIVPSLGLMVSWTGVTVPGDSVSFPHDVLRAVIAAFRAPALPDPGPYTPLPDVSLADPMVSNPDALFGVLGLGPAAYPGCNVAACLGKPLAAPYGDWPPGCFILGCVGTQPATPGIR
ncbi:serine hydrolase [Nocardia sp. NPDC051832]|uniref:serine hydrolase domain-containing protein n=1 Tax=Nocardia sp. NPDC051832 TaxID=3155673 RepID=UPI0034452649